MYTCTHLCIPQLPTSCTQAGYATVNIYTDTLWSLHFVGRLSPCSQSLMQLATCHIWSVEEDECSVTPNESDKMSDINYSTTYHTLAGSVGDPYAFHL